MKRFRADIPGTQTAMGALRTALSVIWSESDGYTKRQLAKSFSYLVIGSTLSALLPVVYKLIIDQFGGVRSDSILLQPPALICAYVLCMYVLNTSTVLRQFVHGTGTQRLNRCLSNRLFGHIVRLPLRFHLDRKTGAIGETLSQGLNGCQILLQHVVFTFLPVLVEFLTIVVVLVHLNHLPYLAIIGISTVVYGFAFWRSAEGVSEPSRIVSATHVNAHATLTDSLLNYETVKFFDGETVVCSRYDQALKERESAWGGLLRLKAAYGTALEAIYAISVGTAMGYAGYQVLHGTMTVGDFVLINTYVMRLYQPIEAIGNAARDMSQGLSFLQKMFEIFREPPEGGSAPIGPMPGKARGELTFNSVEFSYKSDRPILKSISFTVPAGRTIAIVGGSGSGKSSLVRLLFRLYEPDSGMILLDGVPVRNMPLSSLRQAVAVVPQDTVLFNDTIGNNIGFGRSGATQLEIEQAARLARLHTFISGLPDGYSTPVGERGLKLSGGEKQRVAIARAALKRPAIFVFDEATSSLDSRTEKEILRNLIDVSRSSTTLVIAHRLSTVVHADEILVLEQGIIIERGTHFELLSKGASYAALWLAQQSGEAQQLSPATSAA
jgi:ATP-binding cassette subfamily B protein